MLAFRPSPEIPGFNLHYLAAARQWIKNKTDNTQQVDIGHIRKSALTGEEIEEAGRVILLLLLLFLNFYSLTDNVNSLA